MERLRLDNGMMYLAWLSNVLFPFGMVGYFLYQWQTNPDFSEAWVFLIPLSLFAVFSSLMVVRFKIIEFDKDYVIVKNILGKEIASFPIRDIQSVDKMMFSFSSGNRRKGAKNYRITYSDGNGGIRKVRFMSTVAKEPVNQFKKATAFLGDKGFRPE